MAVLHRVQAPEWDALRAVFRRCFPVKLVFTINNDIDHGARLQATPAILQIVEDGKSLTVLSGDVIRVY